MTISREEVLDALSNVIDPDLGKDLVTLNMIRDLRIDGRQIAFTVMLTTPACPLKEQIERACRNAVHHLVSDDAEISIRMDSEVTSRSSAGTSPGNEGLLRGVKNTIAVASGKGGVGKSTVAVNLALALAQSGARVGIVDTDIYGPSIPLMLGATGERPHVNDQKKIIPLVRFGVKILSMGFLVDPTQAVVWRGPMVSSAVRQFLADAEWGDLDYLVLDLPPGTGDIQLTIVQTIPLTGAVIVSTPQEIALADARKGVAMFNNVNVPVLGIVENMAFFTPPDLPERKYYLFGKGGAQRLAGELDVPFLGEIPIEQEVREGGDSGEPIVVTRPDSAAARAFVSLAETTAQQVSIRNAGVEPTEKIEILYR